MILAGERGFPVERKSMSLDCASRFASESSGSARDDKVFLNILMMGNFMIVLASASPRRQEILRNAGISFEVQIANIDEKVLEGESPRECAERLAREKAHAVAKQQPGGYVLGADTIVVVDGEILGKPRDTDDAARMLRMLSGRGHEVITGVCLIAPGWAESVQSERTLVAMSAISEKEIQAYIETGEPMDKAGAYAIQGMASRWIPRIEGDYFNVVGLPMALVWRMLKEKGFSGMAEGTD